MYESKENRSTIDIATLSDGELARVIVANEIANETDSRLVDELWRRLDSTLAKAAKAAAAYPRETKTFSSNSFSYHLSTLPSVS